MSSEDGSMPAYPCGRNCVYQPQFAAGTGNACAGLANIFIEKKTSAILGNLATASAGARTAALR